MIKKVTPEFVKEMINSLEKVYSQLQDTFIAALRESIFDVYPNVTGVSWEGYTPYFNDGEECSYRAYVDYPEIQFKGNLEYKSEYDVYSSHKEDNPGPFADLKKILRAIPDTMFRDMFGDHIKISIYKKDDIIRFNTTLIEHE